MYQIHLRSRVSRLVVLAAHWQAALARPRAAAPRPRPASVRAGLANLATLRVMPSALPGSTAAHDPRDPCNW